MSTDATSGQELINASLRDAVRNGAKLIRDCCAAIVSAISDHPGRNASNSEGHSLGEALEVMLKRRNLLEDSFPTLLSEAILDVPSKREAATQAPIKFQTLELLDDAAVQEKVEAARALQTLAMRLDAVLPQLDGLMSALLGHATVVSALNPLRPELFLKAVQRSFAKASPSMEVQKIWYAHAVPVLAQELKALYLGVIDDLKNQGVKPVEYFVRKSPPPAASTPSASTAPVASSTPPPLTNPWQPAQAAAQFYGRSGGIGGDGAHPGGRGGGGGGPGGGSSGHSAVFNPDATGTFRVARSAQTQNVRAGFASDGDSAHQPGGHAGFGGGADLNQAMPAGHYLAAGTSTAHADQGAAMLTVNRLRHMLNARSPLGSTGDGASNALPAGTQGTASGASPGMSVDAAFGLSPSAGPIAGLPGQLAVGGVAASAGFQAAMLWQGAGQSADAVDPEAAAAAEAAMVEQVAEGALRVMIEAIALDERLLEPVRKLVLRLEPSLGQLVKADLEFFSDEFHPARVLLDELCQRGLGHTDAESEQFLEFMLPVPGLLRHIESHAEMNAAVFARALVKAQSAWEAQDAERERQAQAAVAALLRAERRDEYTTKVAAQILALPDLLGVPDAVIDFLTGPWARVIAQAEFESVLTNADTQRYRAVIADLSWSTKLEYAGKNRNRLVRMVPPMVAALRAGLATIEYSAEEQQSFFGHLMQWHEQALRPMAGPTHQTAGSVAKRQGVENSDSAWVAHDEIKHSGFVSGFPSTQPPGGQGEPASEARELRAVRETAEARMESLTVGSWVEVMIQQRWLRLQLSWMSPQGKLFMFTGADGSSHSMSKRSLHQLFTSNNVRLLAQRKIIERALDAVADRALANTLADK